MIQLPVTTQTGLILSLQWFDTVGWATGRASAACKKLDVGLLVMIGLIAPVVQLSPLTTTSIILCFNKHRLTQVHVENGR